MFYKKSNFICLPFIIAFLIDSRWVGILEIIEIFSQVKIKIGTLSCCTYNSENFSRKLTLSVVEMQQLADFEKTDSKEVVSCLE